MENSKDHIRQFLLYEFQLGRNASEATRNICQAKGDGSMSYATACRWFKRFRNNNFSLDDEPRSGRPTEINLDELKQTIESDPSLTTRAVASKLGCSHKAILYHFNKFRLVSKLGDWDPHDLTPNQLKKRHDVCKQLLSLRRNTEWLRYLITGDEKWVLHVNTTRKRQWLQPGIKPRPTPKPGLHPKKRMLCVWWGVRGVIYWELLPENSTLTASKYSIQLTKVAAELEKKGLNGNQIYFQHDNARPHVAGGVKAKIKQLGWELLPHPPYSPDLAPSDYHLFLSLSNDLRDRKFTNETDLKSYLQAFFDSKSQEFYAKGIHELPKRWQQVIDSNGAYYVKN